MAAGGRGPPPRIDVRKTYKLYIGGAFPRTESGRTYLVSGPGGRPLANACRASRKDVRDAVRAARKAFEPWAARTAMNRGQILYRVAELMEGRRDQFVAEVAAGEGLTRARAGTVVDQAIDRWVWYAGWADKLGQVLGNSNPVAGPFFNFTIPEPTGVVGVVAPERSSLLGPRQPAGPGDRQRQRGGRPGVGDPAARGGDPGRGPGHLGRARRRGQHRDRATAPSWCRSWPRTSTSTRSTPGASSSPTSAAVEVAAADSVKRLARRPAGVADARFDWTDDRAAQRPEWIAAFLEMKTVWHPIGA